MDYDPDLSDPMPPDAVTHTFRAGQLVEYWALSPTRIHAPFWWVDAVVVRDPGGDLERRVRITLQVNGEWVERSVKARRLRDAEFSS